MERATGKLVEAHEFLDRIWSEVRRYRIENNKAPRFIVLPFDKRDWLLSLMSPNGVSASTISIAHEKHQQLVIYLFSHYEVLFSFSNTAREFEVLGSLS